MEVLRYTRAGTYSNLSVSFEVIDMGFLPRPDDSVRSVLELTPEWLAFRGIFGILLDVDNTLVGYRDKEPDRTVQAWLESLKKAGVRAAVISNGKHKRVERFCQNRLPYAARAKKPKPDALLEMARDLGVPPERMAMVGDQLRTDIAAGCRAGMRTVWVEPFRPSLPARFRRTLEKVCMKSR